MPKSKIFLPDVNVWMALVSCRHVRSELCAAWLSSLNAVGEMALARLLTSETVMGEDVVSWRGGWHVASETLLLA